MAYIFHTSLKPIRVEALVEAHDWVLPRDHYFPGESHDFWELVFVVEGFVAQTADERVYHLSQGNLVFIKPLAFHRMWIERNSPTRVILLSFRASGEWMRQLEDSCFALNPAQQKHIKKLLLTTRSDTDTVIDLSYETDCGSRQDLTPVRAYSYRLLPRNLSFRYLGVRRFAHVSVRVPGCRYVQYFTLRLSNNQPGCDLSIVSAQVFAELVIKER